MKPYLEQYTPTDVPEEARPTPPLPIVEGAELVSDDSEDDIAVQGAAEPSAAGEEERHRDVQEIPRLAGGIFPIALEA